MRTKNMEDQTELREALECSVCLDVLSVDNKVLPCQHTFCTECLRAVKLSLDDQHLIFRCPECRRVVAGDIDHLPSNIILKRVLSNLNSPKAKLKSIDTQSDEESQESPSGRAVRKRIRRPVDSDDTEDSDVELPGSGPKKGRKCKPVYVSEEESAESDEYQTLEEYASSEAGDAEAAMGASDTEAISEEEAVSENEDATNEATSGDSEIESLSDTELPDLDTGPHQTPEDQRTAADGGSSSRRSSRIKEKHSRHFHKPQKKDVFNAIPSLPDDNKSLNELRPRKLITDFTKVNSHYNHDPDFTSGEDSEMADFLDDEYDYIDEDSLVSEDSNYDPNEKRVQSRRKQCKKTVGCGSSSSEEPSASDGTEYSIEDSDSAYTETPSGKKGHNTRKRRFQRVRRSQDASSSSESEDADGESGQSDSEEDMGELSRSILDKVNERSKTMSERKQKQASKFEELKKARKQRQKRH